MQEVQLITGEVTTKLGRVQLVTGTPQMAPGKCVICGTSGDSASRFIDTGWDIDFYGVVYFCLNCIKEAAAVLSMVPEEKYLDVLESYNQLDFKFSALSDENEGLRNVISSLHSYGFDSSDRKSDSDSSKPLVDEKSEATKPSSGKASPAKSRSAKQTNVSGSPDVRFNDSIAGNNPIPDL